MFAKNFYWGAATASAQIEGGYNSGGRSPSTWDFAADFTTGKYIKNGNKPHVSCDHYGRMKQDVALMKQIGLKAYRFSVSWSRLIPSGDGEIANDGLRFYNELIDELLKNGIEPFVTLFHWDYPQTLQNRGGWTNPSSVRWYENYAKQISALFSDRVKFFFTFNEPEVYVNEGYLTAEHAPFYKLPPEVCFQISHNILLANAYGFSAIKAAAKRPVQVGQAHCIDARIPATESPEDIAAAKRAMFNNGGAHFWDGWFMEAINRGVYIEERLKSFGSGIKFPQKDMEIIHVKPDFFGYNTYKGFVTRAGENGEPVNVDYPANTDFTPMGWAVTPECLYWNSKFFAERYGLSVFIAENGVALSEWPDSKGEINDDSRIEYIRAHLLHVERAIDEGADIRGYFYWSLMDNFEWAHGNSKRFGLIRTDFNTLERKLKKSAQYYSQIIQTNGTNIK